MKHAHWFGGLIVLTIILATPPRAARAQAGGEPSFQERVYARTLGQVASPGAGAEVRRVRRTYPGGAARGVVVEAPGLEVQRLRFPSPEAAAEYARGLGRGLVESRGDQVVILDGPLLAEDPARSGLLLDAAWGTLPAPDAPVSHRRTPAPPALPAPTDAAAPPPPQSEPSTPSGSRPTLAEPEATRPAPAPPAPLPPAQGPVQGVEDRLLQRFGLDPTHDGPRQGGLSGKQPEPARFDRMWEAYPRGSAEEVKALIGGGVDMDWVTNTCAIRVSHALNETGEPIQRGQRLKDGRRVETTYGADGDRYIYRVSEMERYLRDRYGPPSVVQDNGGDGGPVPKDMVGRRGVVLFDVDVWSDATGHVDLWNGREAAGDAYFDQARRVMFWELNDR